MYDKVRIGEEKSRRERVNRLLQVFEDEGCRMVEMSCEVGRTVPPPALSPNPNLQSLIPNPQSATPESRIPNPQYPILIPKSFIPNPQSPIPNPQLPPQQPARNAVVGDRPPCCARR